MTITDGEGDTAVRAIRDGHISLFESAMQLIESGRWELDHVTDTEVHLRSTRSNLRAILGSVF
jgi:hypothetical protein